jgi:hypothetical protein
MAQQISEERKSLYNAGLVILIIGGCLFSLPFITILLTMVTGGGRSSGIVMVPIAFVAAFIGFGLVVIGSIMRTIAAKGKAGSGLVLDPEQARRDVEPWSRMQGGIIKDTLDEAGINLEQIGRQFAQGNSSQPQKMVMIKCPHCKKLNDEDSKFCQECGKPV